MRILHSYKKTVVVTNFARVRSCVHIKTRGLQRCLVVASSVAGHARLLSFAFKPSGLGYRQSRLEDAKKDDGKRAQFHKEERAAPRQASRARRGSRGNARALFY